ncbi:MAG: HEAT repeat domain-containing protein [Planctomycetota bacterium]
MARLTDDVRRFLVEEGLDVEEDRGGFLVRTGPGETPVSVWVNENDRVVRAEQVLAYPVDDYSEPLGHALSWLNLNRAGVKFSFQEAQRAVVGTTMWTSPGRPPTPSQVHLLVALLLRARARDSSPLSRVAEGEASWEEVADTEGVSPRRASGRHDPLTLRFTTSRFDPEELRAQAAASESESLEAAWREPPTRPLDRIGDGSFAQAGRPIEAPTKSWGEEDRREIAAQNEARRTGRHARGAEGEAEEDGEDGPAEGPRTARLSLQLAVQAADRAKDYDKQDLTVEGRSLGRRLVRFVLFLVVFVPVVLVLFHRIVAPFVPRQYHFWAPLFDAIGLKSDAKDPRPLPTATAEGPLEARRMIPPGPELLRAELEDPLGDPEAADRVEISLRLIGDKKKSVLESIILQSPSEPAHKRAYELWIREKLAEEPGARLELMRQVIAIKQPRKVIVEYLLADLAKRPPRDEALIASLEWASPELWRFVVDRLGRPGEGAEQRAKVLTGQLPKDTDDMVVLRGLIRTGQAPPEALNKLVAKRGLKWCEGQEGRDLLLSLVRRYPDAADGLLTHEKVEFAAFAVDLIAEADGEAAISKLVEVVRDKIGTPVKTWIRQKAARALRKNTPSVATWPLVFVLNTQDTPPDLAQDVQRVLRSYPGPQGVRDLEPFTSSDRSSTRRYAVNGLTAMATPAATERLIQRLEQEPDVRVRQLVAANLGELQKEHALQTTLQRGLSTFHHVSRTDSDPTVRREAERLYRSLAGR